ncbi:MAG: hypothetical protein UY60_C0019G0005 [Parcubacteria group bacterium GW2011_GWB1_50_9]|uniref:DUF8128 domain-containing protein n=1 Tax=Candidatus Kaiserbacteria bacterium GW2011_GWC2_52_8b TaxID=1618676 RepID=A0A0G1ZNV8_9BACT|nr:MAG: hypothetical protein UY60_C0019G0005 [Parcubacteria group bacterium GW2011_GWB1_50_9]KKW29837.1 MAG: hypothetical protein UY74_C0062G0004 [Candidatus Kaiserbacteria bacterium GW2011_GWC2_52_8b]
MSFAFSANLFRRILALGALFLFGSIPCMEFIESGSQFFEFIVPWLISLWWLYIFVGLVLLLPNMWLTYVQECFKRSVKWTLLEIRIPREHIKPPRAMEQVFMTMHAIRNSASDLRENWWDGEVPLWFSCEAVSFGGEVHLYIRTPEVRKNHIEASFYASYPDIEIIEVKDYIDRLPPTFDELTRADYRMFGNELILKNKDVYPIMTYEDFEVAVKEKEVDPVAALLETLRRIKPQEHLWMQILVRPKVEQDIGFRSEDQIGDWHKEGEKEIEHIKEITGKRKIMSPTLGEFIMMDRSPGDVEMMKAIDRNISKPGFNVIIRYLYISPKEMFVSSFGRRSILMAMNQYASETFNKFGHNTAAWTLAKFWYWPHLFPKRRARAKSIRIYENYRKRAMYAETFVGDFMNMKFFNFGFKQKRKTKVSLNTEELATIFHLPTGQVVTGHLLKRSEAKKAGPPAELPIFGEGGSDLPLERDDKDI